MKGNFITIVLLLFSLSTHAQLGPVQPTKDTTSQSQVKDTTNLQLPYQPADPATIPNSEISETISVDQTAQEIDWTKIPFIPFKTPKLPHAPDPALGSGAEISHEVKK